MINKFQLFIFVSQRFFIYNAICTNLLELFANLNVTFMNIEIHLFYAHELSDDQLKKRGNDSFQAYLDKTLVAYHILLRS